ncbi:hypothetical protein AAKU52_002374 [Pedobacter sp. CG_S7]|uniref:hypothetical protein n=1 Tax=Pedobacter sp. CG_S7 TaxID=3143930 RepID=UPI003392DE05
MKNVLSLCLIALLFVSCSKKSEDGISPATDKKVRVEVDLSGNYQNYQLLFAVTTLTTSTGGFVAPEITTPANTSWTQIIAEGNAYNYIGEPKNSKLIIESKTVAGNLAFTLLATQVNNTDDTAQIPITAVVKVFADGTLLDTFNYTAKPVGQVTDPLVKSIKIN